MFGITHYDVFILSGIIINLTPGADTMYILGSSLANGKKAGIISALGISSGCMVHTVLAALGLSVILSQSALAFNIIKYLGAAYLVYLGLRSFLSNSSLLTQDESHQNHSLIKIYLQGIMTNVLNPKVALFFLAFLPQFINPHHSYGMLPFLLLGLTFIATGTLWCMVLAVGSSYFADKLNEKTKAGNWLSKISGVIFIGLGLNLLRAKLVN